LVCKLRDCCGDLEDSILFELRVVLSEMLVNAIRHGNREDENKTVKIRAGIVDDGNLFIIVEDEGSGYDFKNIWKRHKSCNETVSPLEIESCGREFDPGSGRTLAACLTHASRAEMRKIYRRLLS
jgi:serine/threonine-protein kinase RsbW